MKIYKEVLPFITNDIFTLTIAGELFAIIQQRGNLVAYFYSIPTIRNTYDIILAETGVENYPIDDMEYMGTFMFYGDSYVLHAFAKLKESIK